mmetsp:Transcript_50449/g.98691  ORF Transcript_50449/g.98691 Transcript_50449/m.98691 type:complete len:386 (-) Transcript_50449:447-1604(-)
MGYCKSHVEPYASPCVPEDSCEDIGHVDIAPLFTLVKELVVHPSGIHNPGDDRIENKLGNRSAAPKSVHDLDKTVCAGEIEEYEKKRRKHDEKGSVPHRQIQAFLFRDRPLRRRGGGTPSAHARASSGIRRHSEIFLPSLSQVAPRGVACENGDGHTQSPYEDSSHVHRRCPPPLQHDGRRPVPFARRGQQHLTLFHGSEHIHRICLVFPIPVEVLVEVPGAASLVGGSRKILKNGSGRIEGVAGEEAEVAGAAGIIGCSVVCRNCGGVREGNGGCAHCAVAAAAVVVVEIARPLHARPLSPVSSSRFGFVVTVLARQSLVNHYRRSTHSICILRLDRKGTSASWNQQGHSAAQYTAARCGRRILPGIVAEQRGGEGTIPQSRGG